MTFPMIFHDIEGYLEFTRPASYDSSPDTTEKTIKNCGATVVTMDQIMSTLDECQPQAAV